MSILYILLAIIGLGVLIFIHELGHYFMAKRAKMRVETFAIGFGKPLISWKRNGVTWQVCCLPFGGYVKIAGMHKEQGLEPHQIPGGFFAAKPWARIKVAMMGPLVNVAFALVAFSILWVTGGREQMFQMFTNRIGWLDHRSTLYEYGVRSGDEIIDYDDKPFHGFKDLLIASVIHDESSRIRGYKIDYLQREKIPFDYTISPYEDPRLQHEGMSTVGIIAPASYLLYKKPAPQQQPLLKGSPLYHSGIEYGDRILWINGELVFSLHQMQALLSESATFLTIERDGEIFHSKIPRVRLDDLHLLPEEFFEIDDWRYESGIFANMKDVFFIPYRIRYDNIVEGRLRFIEDQDEEKAFLHCRRCSFFNPLRVGDRIVAIDGRPVKDSAALLQELQQAHALMIVQRDPEAVKEISWADANRDFDAFLSPKELQTIVRSIGTDGLVAHKGSLHLLRRMTPKNLLAFPDSVEKTKMLQNLDKHREAIEHMEDSEKRQELLVQLEQQLTQPYLGVMALQDRMVRYNPNPFVLFKDVLQEIWHTFRALFSGHLHPKWLAGPIGIIHMVKNSWMVGVKEALFWMGVISLNLGILNLLPIPVLDGGHITFSLWEMVTKRPVKAKTMERLIIPFVMLLIGMIVFVTYHDVMRLLSRFF
jgi:regulator of sigma E protease